MASMAKNDIFIYKERTRYINHVTFTNLRRATFIQEAMYINSRDIVRGYVYLRGYVN